MLHWEDTNSKWIPIQKSGKFPHNSIFYSKATKIVSAISLTWIETSKLKCGSQKFDWSKKNLFGWNLIWLDDDRKLMRWNIHVEVNQEQEETFSFSSIFLAFIFRLNENMIVTLHHKSISFIFAREYWVLSLIYVVLPVSFSVSRPFTGRIYWFFFFFLFFPISFST